MDKIPFSIYDFFGYLASGFILCVVGDYIVGRGWLMRDTIPVQQLAAWIVAAYIVGHINANLSSFFLEQILVGKILHRPNRILFSDKVSLPILPRFIFPGYNSPLSKSLIERITKTAEAHGVTVGNEMFFHHARTLAKSQKETWARMDTFLQLYGFCRNVSFSLFVAALLLAGTSLRYCSRESGTLAIVAILASIGMLYRYLKFFRQYSYELFTAYPDLASGNSTKGG